MYRIVRKEALKPTVILYEIEAPLIARKAQPGQFIILRVDENGERIPLTIHGFRAVKGCDHRSNQSISIFQSFFHSSLSGLPAGAPFR